MSKVVVDPESSPSPPQNPPARQSKVIAVHGFCGHWLVMTPLCRQLRIFGYQVQNWGYRSVWRDIPFHAKRLQSVLEELECDDSTEKIHIVAHSMGSILVRVMLQQYQPAKLERVVMVTPPNRGSHMATKASYLFGWLSTTLTQITDKADSYVNTLGPEVPLQYEIGIIQAQTDLVVADECTHLQAAREVIQLPGFHSSVVAKIRTAEAVHRFFEHGSFIEAN